MSAHRSSRLPAALLVASALTAFAAACGGKQGTQVDGQVLVRAAIATTSAGTAHTAATAHESVSGLSLDLKGTGVIDMRRRRAEIVLRPLSKNPIVAAFGGTVITDGLTIYTNYDSEQVRTALSLDEPWAKVDGQRTEQAAGVDPAAASGANDPAGQFQLLLGVTGKVESFGKETVHGVSATHYHTVVKYADYAARVPPARHAAALAVVKQLELITGKSSQALDVWVDAQGRIVQLRRALPVHIRAGELAGQTFTVKATIDYSDFGAPVHIALPPVSQTEDLTDRILQAQQDAQP